MKSFLHGKKCVEVSALRPPGAAASGRIASGGSASPLAPPSTVAGGAHVEVVKEGGKVVRLIVTCACGERTEIDCLYSAGS